MLGRPPSRTQQKASCFYRPPTIRVLRECENLLVIGIPRLPSMLFGTVLLAADAALVFKFRDFLFGGVSSEAIMLLLGSIPYVLAAVVAGLGIKFLLWNVRVFVDSGAGTICFLKRLGPIVVRRREYPRQRLRCVGLTNVRRKEPLQDRISFAGGRPWHWEFSGFVVTMEGLTEEFSCSSDLAHEESLCQKVAACLRVPLRVTVPEGVKETVAHAKSTLRKWAILGVVCVCLLEVLWIIFWT